MGVVIDAVLKEWGDRLYYVRTRARPAPKNVCGFRPKSRPEAKGGNTAGIVRGALKRTVKKAPEVLVKVSGGGKSMSRIKAHFDYISRNGDVPLEDEAGHAIEGKEALGRLRDDWKMSADGATIPYEDGYRREAFNIVLSMPEGTDRDAVRSAAREFAKANFDGHMYVFASHDDEKHPHVHLCVKAVGRDMTRLNPRKADLQEWRESFAEKLRENGIEANATPRAVRGQVRRPERQAVRHIQRRGAPSWTKKKQAEAVAADVAAGRSGVTEHDAKLKKRRAEVVDRYGHIAKALAGSEMESDRRLAVGLAQHVKEMPEPKTAHRLAVEAARQQQHGGGVDRAAARQQDREQGRAAKRAGQGREQE